jgi:hypothetical protein
VIPCVKVSKIINFMLGVFQLMNKLAPCFAISEKMLTQSGRLYA